MPGGIFQRVRRTVGLALVLALGAMLRYPGGTALDATTRGYSMSRNFLSDLGMTVATVLLTLALVYMSREADRARRALRAG